MKDSGNAAIVQDGYESSEVLVVSNDNLEIESIMDSCCSWRMTPNISCFDEEFSDQAERLVLLQNNKPCKIAGIRSIRFRLYDGVERLLIEVRYAPNLKRILISLGELDKKGYVFKGEQGLLKAVKGSMVVMKGIKKNGLYSLEGDIVIGSTTSISEKLVSKTELWHMRLGHVSEKGLIKLETYI